jgi:putative (di)nucleoside polyphosphate hydrolase
MTLRGGLVVAPLFFGGRGPCSKSSNDPHLTSQIMPPTLPYRPCVGIMLLNRDGRVFIGRRSDGPEHVDARHAWQMPQGGIDPDEDPRQAALRELYEETNIRSVERLGETKDWLTYDIPPEIIGRAWKGKYRGQRQKWYALRFTGDESEIDVAHPAGGHEPEFRAWRWEPMENLPTLIVPFKRKVYEQVVAAFRHLAAPRGAR